MSLFRLLQGLALLLVLGLLALLGWRLVTGDSGTKLVNSIGQGEQPPAPSFTLPLIWRAAATWPPGARTALLREQLALRDLRGRPVVLNFWASWCGPCKDEAPRLVASAREHAGAVLFLGVDVQDLRSDARRFLRRFDVDYPSVRDSSGATYDDYGLTGVPETYWLDRRGRIVAHSAGEITRDEIEQGIAQASETP